MNHEWFQRKLHRLENRAIERGVAFDLTVPDLKFKFLENHCPVCKVLYSTEENVPNGRSIDRLIPSHGYTRNNIVTLCRQCNTTKDAYTVRELYDLGHNKIASWVEKEIKKAEQLYLEELNQKTVKPQPPEVKNVEAEAVKQGPAQIVSSSSIVLKRNGKLDKIGELLSFTGFVLLNREQYLKDLRDEWRVWYTSKSNTFNGVKE